MALEVLAGDIILADHHNALVPTTVAKSAATPRDTTTTFSADPHLAIPLPVGEFDLRTMLLLTSAANAAGDFQARWAWTGTMQVELAADGAASTLASGTAGDGEYAGAGADTTSPSAAVGFGVSTTMTRASLDAHVTVTVAGTLTLEWTQLSSNANATTLGARSRITAFPVA